MPRLSTAICCSPQVRRPSPPQHRSSGTDSDEADDEHLFQAVESLKQIGTGGLPGITRFLETLKQQPHGGKPATAAAGGTAAAAAGATTAGGSAAAPSLAALNPTAAINPAAPPAQAPALPPPQPLPAHLSGAMDRTLETLRDPASALRAVQGAWPPQAPDTRAEARQSVLQLLGEDAVDYQQVRFSVRTLFQ